MSRFTMTCPECHAEVSLSARRLTEVVPAGPAFTHDDLLDLHSALACETWIDQLVVGPDA